MAKFIVKLAMEISANGKSEAAKAFLQKIKYSLNGSQADIEELVAALQFTAEPSQPEMERSK